MPTTTLTLTQEQLAAIVSAAIATAMGETANVTTEKPPAKPVDYAKRAIGTAHIRANYVKMVDTAVAHVTARNVKVLATDAPITKDDVCKMLFIYTDADYASRDSFPYPRNWDISAKRSRKSGKIVLVRKFDDDLRSLK